MCSCTKPVDVADEAQAIATADSAATRSGRIDVHLNNAGYGLLGAVEEASAHEVEPQFGTNVFGVPNVTRAVLPHMRRAGKGHAINICSIGGYAACAGWGVFGARKVRRGTSDRGAGDGTGAAGNPCDGVEPGFYRTDPWTTRRRFARGRKFATTRPPSVRCGPSARRPTTGNRATRRSWPGDLPGGPPSCEREARRMSAPWAGPPVGDAHA
jgi:NAD(P)-dependent dehydrogenase (short-subunit alcohol dehydrogenase family)